MSDADGLSTLLRAGAAQPALAAHLDSILPAERIAQVRSLSGGDLRTLFERCADAAPFSLHDLVPAEVTAGQTAIFCGLNSLPLFRTFEKRFTRLPSGAVVGYNHQVMSPLTGPGYFTITPAPRGELLFDYTATPPADAVPTGWPAVRGNGQGFSRLVYKDLHDFCRRVSRDVIIGRATRLGKPMNQYFILARGEVLP